MRTRAWENNLQEIWLISNKILTRFELESVKNVPPTRAGMFRHSVAPVKSLFFVYFREETIKNLFSAASAGNSWEFSSWKMSKIVVSYQMHYKCRRLEFVAQYLYNVDKVSSKPLGAPMELDVWRFRAKARMDLFLWVTFWRVTIHNVFTNVVWSLFTWHRFTQISTFCCWLAKGTKQRHQAPRSRTCFPIRNGPEKGKRMQQESEAEEDSRRGNWWRVPMLRSRSSDGRFVCVCQRTKQQKHSRPILFLCLSGVPNGKQILLASHCHSNDRILLKRKPFFGNHFIFAWIRISNNQQKIFRRCYRK